MDQMKKRIALVTKEREVRVHAELWYTANFLLEAGQRELEGATHQFRASLVFRAFALEAFLNWIGKQLIPHWEYLERLSPRQKLDLLLDLVSVQPNFGERPWQIIKELFGFRNDIAHGKPENIRSEAEEKVDGLLDSKLGEFIRTDWEKFCTEANAVRAMEDVLEIVTIVYEKANLKHDGPRDPFAPGFQVHGATLSR